MEFASPEKEIEFKPVVLADGTVKLKRKSEITKGKKSKSSGLQFEARVRADLEEKGWVVDKWSNNVDLDVGRVVPAKRKFNPFSKVMTIGTGFPDFIALQLAGKGTHRVIGVEVKVNGKLSRVEKEKCRWYLDKGIFSEILIAQKVKQGRKITVSYQNVLETFRRMR